MTRIRRASPGHGGPPRPLGGRAVATDLVEEPGRCEIWEITRDVCALAQSLAPATSLRALDALHLATFSLARRRIEGLELLTTDERLRTASGLSA